MPSVLEVPLQLGPCCTTPAAQRSPKPETASGGQQPRDVRVQPWPTASPPLASSPRCAAAGEPSSAHDCIGAGCGWGWEVAENPPRRTIRV